MRIMVLYVCFSMLGFEMVLNVEYNQLDLLLCVFGYLDGDVNDLVIGYFLFLGNINQVKECFLLCVIGCLIGVCGIRYKN